MSAGKLEQTLRNLAERGELTYLSIVPIAGKGGIVYSARYTPATGFGHGDGSDADPVEAMLKAIADKPVPVRRSRRTRAFGDPQSDVAEARALVSEAVMNTHPVDDGDLFTP